MINNIAVHSNMHSFQSNVSLTQQCQLSILHLSNYV